MSGPAVALALAVPGLALLAVLAWRRPALAICAVPLSFPVGQRALPGPASLQVVQVAAAAAAGFVGLLWLRRGRPARPARPVLLAAGLLVLTALLATPLAPDPATALRLDLGYLTGLALAVAVVAACRDPRPVREVALAICAGGGVVCATGLSSASRLRSEYGGALVQNRAAGAFSQPNELGGFAAALLLLGLALLLGRGVRPAARVVAGLAAGAALAALALSLSRGAWIGAVLGLAVLLVLLPGRGRRRLLAGLAALAVAGGTAAVALPDQRVVSVLADRLGSLAAVERNPYDVRPAIWREAARQLDRAPLLGGGPGGYPVRAARTDPLRRAAPLHAHSLVLTVGAEQGLLGVAALLGVVLAGVGAAARARRHAAGNGGGAGEDVLAGAAAALAALLGQGLVDYPLRNPVLATLLWLLVGLLAAATGPAAAASRAQLALTDRIPASTGLGVKSRR